MTEIGEKLDSEELTTTEIKKLIIDELKKYSSKVIIAFSGGEFLLREDHLAILEYTSNSGIYSFINTNATLVNDEKIRQLKDITSDKLIFGFSLNSINDDINKWSRDDRAQTTIDAIKLCNKYDIGFFILVTISQNNLSTLKETMHYLKMKEIPVLRSPFVPRGSAKKFKDLSFNKEQMKDIIFPALNNNYLSYISYCPFFVSPELMEELKEEVGIKQLGCQAGIGFVGISAEGEVAPCVQLLDSKEVSCGNVRDIPLYKILTESELLKKIRDRNNLKGKCGICRYKNVCGGCRALAFYYNNDILAEDPCCFFEPGDATTVSEFEHIQDENVKKFIDFLKYNKPWNTIFS
jgi:radical SAM protein with 4Fe4S-binding SPASM domain